MSPASSRRVATVLRKVWQVTHDHGPSTQRIRRPAASVLKELSPPSWWPVLAQASHSNESSNWRGSPETFGGSRKTPLSGGGERSPYPVSCDVRDVGPPAAGRRSRGVRPPAIRPSSSAAGEPPVRRRERGPRWRSPPRSGRRGRGSVCRRHRPPHRRASASPIRQPVATIQSTRSGRSSSAGRSLLRINSTSREVSSTVSARGARLLVLISELESRTGSTAAAPSWIASANIPERHAPAPSWPHPVRCSWRWRPAPG
jgi:hypothetical protein